MQRSRNSSQLPVTRPEKRRGGVPLEHVVAKRRDGRRPSSLGRERENDDEWKIREAQPLIQLDRNPGFNQHTETHREMFCSKPSGFVRHNWLPPRDPIEKSNTRDFSFLISRAVTPLRAVPLPSIFLDRKCLLRLIRFRSTTPRPLYRSPDLSSSNTEWIVRSIEFWLHLSSTVAGELGRCYPGRRQLRWLVVSEGRGNICSIFLERYDRIRKITRRRWFRVVQKWHSYFYMYRLKRRVWWIIRSNFER